MEKYKFCLRPLCKLEVGLLFKIWEWGLLYILKTVTINIIIFAFIYSQTVHNAESTK